MTGSKFSQHIRQIREFEQLMVTAGEAPWIEQHAKPSRPVDVVLYLGCNIFRTAHLAYEVVDLFRAIGVHFAAVGGPEFCCGIVHHREGDASGAAQLSRATAQKLESFGGKQVVIWCPTCQLRFEDLIQKGEITGLRLIHASAFLAENGARFYFRSALPLRVVVHSHAGKAQRERDGDAVIRILRTVPGVEVLGAVSSPELDYQCSPVLLTHLGASRFCSIQEDLVGKARELGADTLATIYHSCHREWCGAGGPSLPVRNYVSIMAEALGYARRDWYQEFKKLGDPEAIADLSRPVWKTHGLSRQRAKDLAAKYFPSRKD